MLRYCRRIKMARKKDLNPARVDRIGFQFSRLIYRGRHIRM